MTKIDKIIEEINGYIIESSKSKSLWDGKPTEYVSFRIKDKNYCVSCHNESSVIFSDEDMKCYYCGRSVDKCIDRIRQVLRRSQQ